MKKTHFLAFMAFFAAFSVAAQTITVDSVGSEWRISSQIENPDGSKNTAVTAPISTEKAREVLLNMAFLRSEEIAAAERQLKMMRRQKARLEELILQVTGATFETKATELYAAQFVGEWVDGERTLTIEAAKNGKRMVAFFEKKGEKGSVKIDGTSSAVIVGLFVSQKGEPTDVPFSIIEGKLVGELDGQGLSFKRKK